MENGGLDSYEVSKKCFEEWAALGDVGRKMYVDMNLEDSKRHSKEMKAYLNKKDENEDGEGT